MIYAIKKDVYNHLLNDVGTRIDNGVSVQIDPRDVRPLYGVLGLDDTSEFHRRVMPGVQQVKVEEWVPMIKYHVRVLRRDPATTFLYIEVSFLLLSNDGTGEEIDYMERRIRALFDRQVLYNACPLNARYSMAFESAGPEPGVMTSGIEGVLSSVLAFNGATDETVNVGKQPAF